MAWTIGGSPQRESGLVCLHATCGERDAVTNVCRLKISANRCRDHVAGAVKTEAAEHGGVCGELTDLSPMPWGKFQGTPLQDVPASYMFWLWTERGFENNRMNPVADYIRRNLAAFEMEHPDGIWRKK